MPRSFTARLSLRTKFVVFIGAIISAFYLFMLYRTAVFDEKMILKQAEQQARMLYKQILLTRQWAADRQRPVCPRTPGGRGPIRISNCRW